MEEPSTASISVRGVELTIGTREQDLDQALETWTQYDNWRTIVKGKGLMADSRREDPSRRRITSWNRGTTIGFAALLIAILAYLVVEFIY